jgi:hypothetical protein
MFQLHVSEFPYFFHEQGGVYNSFAVICITKEMHLSNTLQVLT